MILNESFLEEERLLEDYEMDIDAMDTGSDEDVDECDGTCNESEDDDLIDDDTISNDDLDDYGDI